MTASKTETPEHVLDSAFIALAGLFEKDESLLVRDVHERAICARWLYHLAPMIESTPELKVDIEYNKERDGVGKATEFWYPYTSQTNKNEKIDSVVPDVLVHERGSNAQNMLAIEVKKHRAPDWSKLQAQMKLLAFVDTPFFYEFGLYICIKPDSVRPEITEALLVRNQRYTAKNEEREKLVSSLPKNLAYEKARSSRHFKGRVPPPPSITLEAAVPQIFEDVLDRIQVPAGV